MSSFMSVFLAVVRPIVAGFCAQRSICPLAQLVKACDCYLQLRVCNHKIVSSSLTGADKEAYVTFFLLCLPLCRSRAALERVS